MLNPNLVGQFSRRVEIALTAGHFDRARRIVDEFEHSATSPVEEITLDSPVSAIDALPIRIASTLARAGIVTVGDAMARTPDELSEIRDLGPKSIRSLIDTLRTLPCVASPLRVVCWPDED